jgi:hypothetical protein
VSELRGTSGEVLDGAEIRRLNELGNQRALDPSRPAYNPLAHVDASKQVEHVTPVEAARIDAEDAADAVADTRADRPKWTLDTPVGEETARDVLERHCGGELSRADANELAEYIKEHRAENPILGVAADQDPLVQRVYVDQLAAGGHHTERHDCWRDDLAQAERARLRLDPADTEDGLKYWRGSDALEGEDRFHFCGEQATRIHDPVAFAVATARILEHPDVKAELDLPFDPDYVPARIEHLTIEELLGRDGHLACSGFRLSGDDIDQAKADRRDFMQAVRAEMLKENCRDPAAEHQRAAEKVHREQGKTVPEVEAIPSFEGGTMWVAFQRKADESGYELMTFHPVPAEKEPA